jgi:hypothetical protein
MIASLHIEFRGQRSRPFRLSRRPASGSCGEDRWKVISYQTIAASGWTKVPWASREALNVLQSFRHMAQAIHPPDESAAQAAPAGAESPPGPGPLASRTERAPRPVRRTESRRRGARESSAVGTVSVAGVGHYRRPRIWIVVTRNWSRRPMSTSAVRSGRP